MERERERDEKGRRNNVAFVRGRNSGYIEHFTMTRYELLDEQRAGKEGDERELGNKRRRLRIAAKSFNGTWLPKSRLRHSEARDYGSLCDQSGSLVSNRLLLWTRILRTRNIPGAQVISFLRQSCPQN